MAGFLSRLSIRLETIPVVQPWSLVRPDHRPGGGSLQVVLTDTMALPVSHWFGADPLIDISFLCNLEIWQDGGGPKILWR